MGLKSEADITRFRLLASLWPSVRAMQVRPVDAMAPPVLVLSSLAAAWPAFSLGKAKPLDLLQQGRGSF